LEKRMIIERVDGSREAGAAFLFLYRQGLLLALQEAGVLSGEQYRRAEELLRRRFGGEAEL